jgi:putative transposase
MTVSNELIDSLLADYKKPEDLIGENGLLKQLTKRLVERALQAEMAEHLGHAKNDSVANATGNTRNGKSKKTLKGEFGELPIEIPRDRHGSFEPQLICPNIKPAGLVLMRRSCRCTPVE